jgi:dCMP deaminase
MTRPTWDQTFFGIMDVWSQRSTCPRLQTGCVIVNKQHQILVSGYNGAPRGMPHCTDVGCIVVDDHCIRAIHAEMNALIQAAHVGTSVDGAAAYVLHRPCLRCIASLAQAGIKEVIYWKPYDSRDPEHDTVENICDRFGIQLYQGDM